MRRFSPALLVCTLLGGSAAGLALRHDVDEATYIAFGESLPAVALVGGLGSGTLIAPDWVLTAAHVPEMLSRGRSDAPLKVSLAGVEYEVARVVTPVERASERDRHDIALLQLAKPVPATIAPIALWDEDVQPGTEFALAGWGVLSVGDAGVEVSPELMTAPTRRLRGGWNVVESFDLDTNLFRARFDGPDKGLELEAGPCVGDSGGPALLRVEGEGDAPASWRVAGVIALVDDTDKDRILGEYGEEFGMTLVAAYGDWIHATIGDQR